MGKKSIDPSQYAVTVERHGGIETGHLAADCKPGCPHYVSPPRTDTTGITLDYRQRILELAFDGIGDPVPSPPVDNDPDVSMALFNLVVTVIREYADHDKYSTWTQLSHDIAEQFEHDWINPNQAQLDYMQAEEVIRQFEHQHGKPTV